jgi:hypothetical protein
LPVRVNSNRVGPAAIGPAGCGVITPLPTVTATVGGAPCAAATAAKTPTTNNAPQAILTERIASPS